MPSVKELNEEFGQLRLRKNEAYSEYKLAKKDMEQFRTAKYDIDCILGIREMPAQRASLSEHANLYLLKASGAYVLHMRLAEGTSPNPLASDFQSDW